MIRGKDVALSALVVGSAAVAGYVLRSGRSSTTTARSKADLGARVVTDVPADATVIDASSRSLHDIPGAKKAIRRAIRNDASEEWEHVTIERDGAWSIVDAIRGSLPYHEGRRGGYNGVYVWYDGQVVVLDAIGWARLETPMQ
ncbi:hypothetical protein HALLA_17305 [Halostagnicola larsenii XH-48]|uniref:Uncharacterized protein n=1 Tax=Halostagnicola larsenii XH-48 TaxID=797299 RepID=W0JNM4_9EURY|nr:hypothetical protein [Halostagnicola larsenii]AHG00296.1 hypothetical protein HALLA_17305 [Halostagnicola larsenii XH-48]